MAPEAKEGILLDKDGTPVFQEERAQARSDSIRSWTAFFPKRSAIGLLGWLMFLPFLLVLFLLLGIFFLIAALFGKVKKI